jgi:hypothetical protein
LGGGKICPKKKSAGKRILFFLPASPKKGEAGSERRQRNPPEADETSKKLTLKTKNRKNFVQRALNKNRFFARTRTQGCLACRAGRKGRRKPNRKD